LTITTAMATKTATKSTISQGVLTDIHSSWAPDDGPQLLR
jgi:hypothetical protein